MAPGNSLSSHARAAPASLQAYAPSTQVHVAAAQVVDLKKRREKSLMSYYPGILCCHFDKTGLWPLARQNTVAHLSQLQPGFRRCRIWGFQSSP